MSLLEMVQRVVGKAVYTTHRLMGYHADYYLVTDETADPMTTRAFTNIAMKPTAIVLVHTPHGPIYRTTAIGGGMFAMEQQPYFLISREALKVGDTYYTPTLHDYFFENGTTTPVFYVNGVFEIQAKTPGWVIKFGMVEDIHQG